ncbi:MAG: hypothetical protein OEZ22_01180 [Spirochaetia bacterium]|nr:hypothetical protein [Spirochaetia bacterium]
MKNIKKYLFIYAILAINTFYCSKKIEEIEPQNNERKTAQEIFQGKIFTGDFFSEKDMDIDYVFVRTDSEKMLKGSLSAVKGIDSKISFYHEKEAKPFKVINDNQSSLAEEFAPFLITKPGVVIAIEPVRAVLDKSYKKLFYEFQIELTNPHYPVEKEPNDTFEEAEQIEKNTIIGYYNCRKSSEKNLEKDFYYFYLEEEKKYLVSAHLTGIQGIDPVLRLYDENQNVLKYSQEKGIGQGENIISLGIEGPQKVFISVNESNGNINTTEYYELKIEKQEFKNNFEYEPNDMIDKASVLSETETEGKIDGRHDIDFYMYQNINEWPVELSVKVVPGENLDLKMEYFKNDETEILFNDSGKEKNEGISNRIIFTNEKIYLKLSPEDWQKDYAISYTIYINEKQPIDNAETEPNDLKENADTLYPDSEIIGYINPNSDIDFYRLKNENQNRYKILLDGISGCKQSLYITDKKGYKTEEKFSQSLGEGISMTTVIEKNGMIAVLCESASENLFEKPYTLLVKTLETE